MMVATMMMMMMMAATMMMMSATMMMMMMMISYQTNHLVDELIILIRYMHEAQYLSQVRWKRVHGITKQDGSTGELSLITIIGHSRSIAISRVKGCI